MGNSFPKPQLYYHTVGKLCIYETELPWKSLHNSNQNADFLTAFTQSHFFNCDDLLFNNYSFFKKIASKSVILLSVQFQRAENLVRTKYTHNLMFKGLIVWMTVEPYCSEICDLTYWEITWVEFNSLEYNNSNPLPPLSTPRI